MHLSGNKRIPKWKKYEFFKQSSYQFSISVKTGILPRLGALHGTKQMIIWGSNFWWIQLVGPIYLSEVFVEFSWLVLPHVSEHYCDGKQSFVFRSILDVFASIFRSNWLILACNIHHRLSDGIATGFIRLFLFCSTRFFLSL